MEKLQAALARAREKREGPEPVRSGGPELSARGKSRQRAAAEGVDASWSSLPNAPVNERRMVQSRIVTADPGLDSMHFDIFRTKLLLECRRHGWTRIAITSPTAGSGKTTAACNIIAGLGRQPEVRGILFDLDLRRPSVARFFGLPSANGFDDVLAGTHSFEDVALRLDQNTILAPTYNRVKDPAKLLLSGNTGTALESIQSAYRPDLMLFDLPPVLVSDEARAFLKLVDAAVIIAGAETATIAQLDECEREVAEYTKVAGIVLNKCQFMEDGYGYSY